MSQSTSPSYQQQQQTQPQQQRTSHHHHQHRHHHRRSAHRHRSQVQAQQVQRPLVPVNQNNQTQQQQKQQLQPPPPAEVQQQYQEVTERAPTKKQLGNAGWTLIHSIAANYPQVASESDQLHATAFLTSIGKLYPCKKCRAHFSRFLASSPPDLTNRQTFMLWACRAHNEVNKRNGKLEFPCTLESLEQRWGDCGCTNKKQ